MNLSKVFNCLSLTLYFINNLNFISKKIKKYIIKLKMLFLNTNTKK